MVVKSRFSQPRQSRLRCAGLLYLNFAVVLLAMTTAKGSLVSELSTAVCQVLSKQEKCTWSGCVPTEWTTEVHGCGHGMLLCENPSRCAGGWQYKCCEVPRELGVSLSPSKRGRIHTPFPGLGRYLDEKAPMASPAHRSKPAVSPVWWWSAVKSNGDTAGVKKGSPPSAAGIGKRERGPRPPTAMGVETGNQGQPEEPAPHSMADFEWDDNAHAEPRDYDRERDNSIDGDGDTNSKPVLSVSVHGN